MDLFIFFALPLATILLSIVLQKILRSPILVAITVFAIFLIVAFAAFMDTLAEALVATIIYTIIAFITALIVQVICEILRRLKRCCPRNNEDVGGESDNNNCRRHRRCGCNNDDLLTISCNCANGGTSDLLTVSSNCLAGESNNNRALTQPVTNNIIEENNGITANIRAFQTYPNNATERMARRGYRRF